MKFSAALLITVTILVGCVSSERATKSEPIYDSQSGESPKLNTISTTDVGSVLYTEFEYTVSPTITLNSSCPTFKSDIPKAQRLVAVKVNDARVFVYHDKDDGQYGELYYLIDRNSNNKIDHYKTYSGTWRPINPEVEYSSSNPVLADKFGYKMELIYQGISDGVMEIFYREFKDDYTKPTLTKVAGYDVNQVGPSKIRFNGALIKILEATNDTITYEVLNGFKRQSTVN